MASKKKPASSKNTLSRQFRLPLAKKWLPNYKGKYIVRGYAKHFYVDLVCAIKDLRLLGVDVSEQYELALKQNLAAIALKKKRKQEQADLENFINSDGDYDFEFIVGYTSGGAPYGILREYPSDQHDQESFDNF